jgi:uncharacterized protein YndB with AHSA1/START domain
MTHSTTVNRASDRELVVTRMFDAPAHAVFNAWTTPALMQQWWAPQSFGMVLSACEMDVRVGGRYRFEFATAGPAPMVFFGRYLEVVPGSRLVWTNEESDGGAVTTITFDERDGRTLLTMHELHPSKQALDEAFDGTNACAPEQFAQLDGLLAG